MSGKEKKWGWVTRSQEEDIDLVDIIRDTRDFGSRRFFIVMAMSVTILAVYLIVNAALFPAPPVVTQGSERSPEYQKLYPPFRLNEATEWHSVRSILDSDRAGRIEAFRGRSAGYALVASLFAMRWNERGLYLANAFILWVTTLVFFFLLIELVEFTYAIAGTFALAFVSPNFFWSLTALPEPLAQLLFVAAALFLVKSLVSRYLRTYAIACGFMLGLELMVMPVCGLCAAIFVVAIMYERGRWSVTDTPVKYLVIGFCTGICVSVAVNLAVTGEVSGPFFPAEMTLAGAGISEIPTASTGWIGGMWRVLFGGVHGLVYIMPAAMLMPLGVITLWRMELRPVAIIMGGTFVFLLGAALIGSAPITGEVPGSRYLMPSIPFIVAVLVFVWSDTTAERIWLLILSLLTVVSCTFGWWVNGPGPFPRSVLNAPVSRTILLARKSILMDRGPVSVKHLEERYRKSLEQGDIILWLATLDQFTLKRIQGHERAVFQYLIEHYERESGGKLKRIDPDDGVRPDLDDVPVAKTAFPDR